MGFNPSTMGGMGVSERLPGSDKHHGAMTSNSSGELNSPFPTMPFFLPSMNGNTLPNISNSAGIVSIASSGDRSHPSETPAKQQRDGSSSNRNSKFPQEMRNSIKNKSSIRYNNLHSIPNVNFFFLN